MSEFTDVEKDMYSSDPSAHSETSEKELERYLDKVENSYHKARRDDWWKQYKLNYKNRQPDQATKRKHDLD